MKRMRSKTLLPALSTILLAGGAFAEDNLTKLGQFKTTGVTEFTTIAQDAPAANSIRNPDRSRQQYQQSRHADHHRGYSHASHASHPQR